MTPSFLTAQNINETAIPHGFFGRSGGVSQGHYQSLNTAVGSNDDPKRVAENRRRCASALGVSPELLLTPFQTHSAHVLAVEKPWSGGAPRADGLVTTQKSLALGVLTADCMPWLMADPEHGVIAAVHAGWRGALDGILENAVEEMVRLGAQPDTICAALGPCLSQSNFEVGLELVTAFIKKHAGAEKFFSPGVTAEKRQFDLAGFGAWRLRQSGVSNIADLAQCTLGAPDAYFSYRASRRSNAPDYGRNLSAILLRDD